MSDIRIAEFAEYGNKFWYKIADDCVDTSEHDKKIRAEVIEKVKKYILLKTKYAKHPKDDYVLVYEMYDWLEEQLKEQNLPKEISGYIKYNCVTCECFPPSAHCGECPRYLAGEEVYTKEQK